ncbi:MAG: hypothetical protein HZA50_05830 [Planctomycetes bacterium]|nr:hypothetical protein [Planctomycetota bacterium]
MKRMLTLLLVALFSPSLVLAADEYVWIEGETPTEKPTPDLPGCTFEGKCEKDIVSGKYLNLSIPEKDTQATLGNDGKIFGYDFEVKTAGKFQIWARIGYEWVRSDFDWRIDDGAFKTLKHTQPTTDLFELWTWCELAWAMLGEQELQPGKHKIQIRHVARTKEKVDKKRGPDGKEVEEKTQVPDRALFMLDCFCIYKGQFRPNGKYKPDQTDFAGETGTKAAAQVFEIAPPAAQAERSVTELNGLWQFARWDELTVPPDKQLKGDEALPDMNQLFWYAMPAPSSKDKALPNMDLCHRYILRTKVRVPAEMKDMSFILDFESFSMIASVFVNGKHCGWSKDCFAQWQCDVTAGVKPGEVNDVAIVFKDHYYAYEPDKKNPLTAEVGARLMFNVPPDVCRSNQGVSFKLLMPVQFCFENGIIAPLRFVATGKAHAKDVFVKTSVKNKELALDVTVRNPSAGPVNVKIENEIIPWNAGKGGAAEKTLAAKELSVPAGQEAAVELKEKWENPKLWWPDDPQLYWVVTKISVDGKVVDVLKTRFGFREWEWNTHLFKLNGVNWQMWADVTDMHTPKRLIETRAKTGVNMFRLWSSSGMKGMTRQQVLDYMDENGMPVRCSGIFDGEMASYGLVEDSQGSDGKNVRVLRQKLFDNWYDQMQAWIKTERNHPSIFIWSLENEVIFINSCNLGTLDIVEPAIRKGAEMVEKLDPTRPTMVDGGRALKNQSMPVNGCHYNDMSDKTWPVGTTERGATVRGRSWRDFPDEAYVARETWYATCNRGAGVWPMAKDKPMLHGECFYANGFAPTEFSAVGGEKCFVGQSEAKPARGLYGKMLCEGYRWNEVSAWHMWLGGDTELYYNSMQPICVFSRQWNWTFPTNSEFKRNLKVFNSTHYSDPIEMACQLKVDGKVIDEKKETFNIPAGAAQEKEYVFKTPQGGQRTAAEFIMTCSVKGKEVFREVKTVAIINPDAAAKPQIAKADLLVLDPAGAVKARLAKRGIEFTEVKSVDDMQAGSKAVIVLGKDAIPADKSTDSKWMALAAGGARIISLEHKTPLRYQAIPADMEVADFAGRIAFAEDLGHPVMAGLDQQDFFTWNNDHILYRNPYKKGTRGARSLIQCDRELGYSALAECQIGDGIMLLCQLVVGEKLDSNPVAQRLFDNMVNYAGAYKPVRKSTAVVCDPASLKAKLLKTVELQFDQQADPVAAMNDKYGIVVIDATPANLKALAGALDKIKAYTGKGGWIMLWGLTPEGLADYNKIVGFDHVIRPCQMEKVVFTAPRDPLTSGMTLRDIVMDTGKNIFAWMSLKFPAEDEFSYIVDYDEVGPFMKMPSLAELGQPADSAKGMDHWPYNLFNNYTADDCWRFCYMICMDPGQKTKWWMELPKEEELVNFSIVQNVIYHKITKINLYFDDDPKPFAIEIKPTHDRQDFSVEGKKAKKITIELADWEKSGTANVLGIDNIWLGVKRPPEFLKNVKPLINIGGLMRYNMGAGGIVLNQINVLDKEVNPINADKKANVVKTLLKNMGAVLSGGKVVVAGANLKYTPIKIPDAKYNAYLAAGKAPAWFTPGPGDMSSLPVGEQKLAGVSYNILDFRTSPVPSCIMLQGYGAAAKDKEVKDIPIKQKADALFFLHTFNPKNETVNWSKDRRITAPPVAFKYVITYADGKTADVPVVWGQGVGNWREKEPGPLMGSVIAWVGPIEKDTEGRKAVLYSMQWDNPRPDAEIASVDVVYGDDKDKWGAPSVLAITAASAAK